MAKDWKEKFITFLSGVGLGALFVMGFRMFRASESIPVPLPPSDSDVVKTQADQGVEQQGNGGEQKVDIPPINILEEEDQQSVDEANSDQPNGHQDEQEASSSENTEDQSASKSSKNDQEQEHSDPSDSGNQASPEATKKKSPRTFSAADPPYLPPAKLPKRLGRMLFSLGKGINNGMLALNHESKTFFGMPIGILLYVLKKFGK